MDDLGGFGRRSVVLTAGEKGPALLRAAAEATEFVAAEEKYSFEGRIGGGGMGEVLLVADRDLRRQIAMKVLRAELAESAEHRLKFVAEAQATSQLEHPGIPPVHDMGLTPSGRIYFSMKLVRGRTLKEVLKDLLLGVRPVKREYSLHKLVTVLERVAEALHFAHEKGVIHRDLKPDNIMLGDHGEVHVMDWGIAKIAGMPEEEALEEPVSTSGMEEGLQTIDGTVKGTIPYMSPEQASGKASKLDRRSDVYALGTILYEILTLHPAFEDRGIGTLNAVCEGKFVSVMERSPRRPVPEALASLCTRAMALDPSDRPESAEAFERELRAWLDGTSEAERRHHEAEALAEKGKEAAARFWQLKEEVRDAERAAEAIAKDYEPWQPVSEKRPLLEARERVDKLGTDLALGFAETVKYLEAALVAERGNASARAGLAGLWRGRLDDAELRGDKADTAYALELLGRYDDGALARVIEGTGALALTTEPESAEAVLYRFVERDGVLVPDEARALGRTPLGPIDLPMGSYLVILKAPGYRDVRYPVHISRNRMWKGTVRLRTEQEIGEGFIYVPGGPFMYGEGRQAEVREIGDFAIARDQVTWGDFIEYLNTLPEEEAEQRKPRTPADGALIDRGSDGVFKALDKMEGPARERYLREQGWAFYPRLPAFGLTWDDAQAYCEWKEKTTGRQWRLPTEKEREKAARGVDGRQFPWGDLEDASLAKCRSSRDEPSQPESVGTFPTARSVYGMEDASGNVWEWTDSWFDERHYLRALRGGSWYHEPQYLRCACRFTYDARWRYPHVGFRCARSLP